MWPKRLELFAMSVPKELLSSVAPIVAVLPATRVLARVRVLLVPFTTPPPKSALLPETVLLVRVRLLNVLLLTTLPPLPLALLPETVLLLNMTVLL